MSLLVLNIKRERRIKTILPRNIKSNLLNLIIINIYRKLYIVTNIIDQNIFNLQHVMVNMIKYVINPSSLYGKESFLIPYRSFSTNSVIITICDKN